MSKIIDELSKKEQILAHQLKAICYENGREKYPTESAKILHKLGLVYKQRSPDKICLIKSCALLNAAKIRNSDNIDEIKQDLQKLCSHVLCVAKANDRNADLVSQSELIAAEIQLMRKETEDALAEVEQIPDDVDEENLNYLEQIKISSMQKIQEQITKRYKNVMNKVGDYCEEVMGKPPCEYALVGVGSIARKEITPYSDFENIIVLEEGCQTAHNYKEILEYFRWFSVIFQIILINLGETILPSVCIKSLNDYTIKGGDWFLDTSARGISFDGMMLHACKSPLGRQQMTADKPWKTELIKPVSWMLNYLKTEETLKQGYHLNDILAKPSFVSGNKSIFEQFKKSVNIELSRKTLEDKKLTIQEQIQDDLSSYGTKLSLSDLHKSICFNVKRVVYRSTTLFISALGRLHDIGASSCFDVITELHDKQVISSFARHKLMYGVALACEIRLRIYMEKKTQDDWAYPYFKSSNITHKLAKLVGIKSVFSYFQITYALQFITCNQLGIDKSHFYSNASLLNISISYYLGNYEKVKQYILQLWSNPNLRFANCFSFESVIQQLAKPIKPTYLKNSNESLDKVLLSYNTVIDFQISQSLLEIGYYLYNMNLISKGSDITKRFLQYIERWPNDFSENVRAEIFYKVAYCETNHFKKLEYYEKSLFLFETTGDIHSQAICQESIGTCLLQMLNHIEAMNYFSKALRIYQKTTVDETTDMNVASILREIGTCLMHMRNYAEAMEYLNKALRIYQKTTVDETTDMNVASILREIGTCLMHMRNYADAMENLNKALHIYQKATIHEATDMNVASTLREIGICLIHMLKYAEAMYYFNKALPIYQKTSVDEITDMNVASILREIGTCLMHMLKYTDAMEHLNKALRIYQKTSVDETTDKNVASALREIGTSLMSKFKHIEEMEHHNKALHIYQQTTVDKIIEMNVASTLREIGTCLMHMLIYTEAMNSFNKALRIYHKTSVDETTDMNVASTLREIGTCLMHMLLYTDAMEHLNKALRIYQKTSVHETTDKKVASTLREIGTCLMHMRKYTDAMEHLNKALHIYQKISVNETTYMNVASTLRGIYPPLMSMFEYIPSVQHRVKSLQFYHKKSVHATTEKDVASTLREIGTCLIHMRKYTDAMEHLNKALHIYQKTSVDETTDKNVASTLREIGTCLMYMLKDTESMEYFNKALRIYQKISVDETTDVNVASTLNNIAFIQEPLRVSPKHHKSVDNKRLHDDPADEAKKGSSISQTKRQLAIPCTSIETISSQEINIETLTKEDLPVSSKNKKSLENESLHNEYSHETQGEQSVIEMPKRQHLIPSTSIQTTSPQETNIGALTKEDLPVLSKNKKSLESESLHNEYSHKTQEEQSVIEMPKRQHRIPSTSIQTTSPQETNIGGQTISPENEKDYSKIVKLVKTVGKTGGKIEFTEYHHCYVEFPPEVLDEDVTFHISILIGRKKDSDDFVLTPTLNCFPSIKFKEPVTISLPTCYKPKNPKVRVVPQTFNEHEWVDEQPIAHGGKDFIVFKATSFSLKRVRAEQSRFSRRFFPTKTVQFIGTRSSIADKLSLDLCVQDKISDFENKKSDDELFRGIIILTKSAEFTFIFESVNCPGIKVDPKEKKIRVRFTQECFDDDKFFVEIDKNVKDEAIKFSYLIKKKSKEVKRGRFLLDVRQSLASSTLQTKYFSSQKVKYVVGNDGFLGKGKFGSVILGKIDALKIVAIKCIPIAGSKHDFEANRSRFANEIEIMQQAAHENIVQVEGYTSWQGTMGIILEYMPGGSLSRVLFHLNCDIPPVVCLQFSYDITNGMTYLHHGFNDQRITHSDLKPGNILLTSYLRCKISDFGGAHFGTCSEYVDQSRKIKRIEYTRAYAAPERLQSLESTGGFVPTTKLMDVYSVGMIFQGILTRKRPPITLQEENSSVNDLKNQYKKQNESEITEIVSEIMKRSRSQQPSDRPLMKDIRDELSVLYSRVNVSDVLGHVTEITRHMDIKQTIPPGSSLKSINEFRFPSRGNNGN